MNSSLKQSEREEVGCRAHGKEHRVSAEHAISCGCALNRRGQAQWAAC